LECLYTEIWVTISVELLLSNNESKRMRIAVWHNLPSGGGKRALYGQVTGLIARGHAVEAWCPPTADRKYLPLDAIIPEHVIDLAPVRYTLSDKLGITLVKKRQIAAMDAHCRVSAEQINRGNFDILLANSCMFFGAAPIGRFTRIPSVIYLGEPYRWLYEAMPRLWWLAPPRRSQSLFRRSALKAVITDFRSIRNYRLQGREEADSAAAFDRILVNSYFSRESVLRAYGLESDVCYLGINTDRFVDRGLKRANMLVGLGSFTSAKNVQTCIEALALVPRPRPRLVWVGNTATSYLDDMRVLARDRHVDFEARVAVSDEELVDILNRARAMLYAPWLEPFGLAPLEAGACGVPVIAVAEGGVRETIIDQVTGLLVEKDPASIASGIAKLIGNPTLAREMGINARLNVQKSWSMVAAIDRLEQRLVHYAGA
jgi:glycosyltransferase involved in cell wall biosynthesis